MQDNEQIGSEAWLGNDVYEADDKYNVLTAQFFDQVKWQVLGSIASRHRGGMAYEYSEKYSIGQFNLVRRLLFADGVSWVVRVRLPVEASPAAILHKPYDGRQAFEVEVASMLFFKAKSTIPVPEVFAYDADPSNEAGVAYMFLEYIHGTTASDLRAIRDSPPASYGTAAQDQKFRRQMAKIHAEVLSFQFPLIGSLYYSKETSCFYIGKDLETGKGPWKTSTDYYRDFADWLLQRLALHGGRNTKESPFFALPVLLNHLMGIHSKERTGPFRIFNQDFGAHNILVDDDFNIVGIIDFDGVMACPLEAVAQYPILSAMGLDPPGAIHTNPHVLARIERTRPGLDHYKACLGQYEAEQGDGSAVVASQLGSTGALVFLGMLRCAGLDPSGIEAWFQAALKLLKDHAAVE